MINNNDLASKIANAEAAMANALWREAILSWDEVIANESIQPPAGAWVRKARALLNLNKFEEAEKTITECLNKFPKYDKAIDLVDIINSKKAQRYSLQVSATNNTSFKMNLDLQRLQNYRTTELQNYRTTELRVGLK